MNDSVNRSSRRKLLLTVIAVILIVAVAAGVTLAYMSMKSGSVNNGFTPGEIKVTIDEDFTTGGRVKKDVFIKNESNTGAYIRAAIAVTWQNANGEVYGEAPVPGKDYTLTRSASGWINGNDGYYYWTSVVPVGGKTENLIDVCEVIGDAPADGYTLHVEIVAQGIQATPKDAVNEAWGVTVDGNGRISK